MRLDSRHTGALLIGISCAFSGLTLIVIAFGFSTNTNPDVLLGGNVGTPCPGTRGGDCFGINPRGSCPQDPSPEQCKNTVCTGAPPPLSNIPTCQAGTYDTTSLTTTVNACCSKGFGTVNCWTNAQNSPVVTCWQRTACAGGACVNQNNQGKFVCSSGNGQPTNGTQLFGAVRAGGRCPAGGG